MAPVASHLIEEVTAHAQSDSLEDAREICVDGTYFPNNLRIKKLEFRQLRTGVLNLLYAIDPLSVEVKNADPFSGKCIK